MSPILGFLELGLIILGWMIFWTFVVKGWAVRHPDLPAAQGISALMGF
jgi:hypothetical protein